MELSLSDISKGRANRVQFLLAVIVLQTANLLVTVNIDNEVLETTTFIVFLCLFINIAIKRSRDLGYDDRTTIKFLLCLISPYLFLTVTHKIIDYFDFALSETILVIFDCIFICFLPMALVATYFILTLHFKRGDPLVNEYGSPQEGWNILAPQVNDYSEHAKSEVEKVISEQNSSPPSASTSEQFEFKGR